MLPIPLISKNLIIDDSIYIGFFSFTNQIIKLNSEGDVIYTLSPRTDGSAARNTVLCDTNDKTYVLFEDTGNNIKLNTYIGTTEVSTFTIT
jgi:hypothetical protein